MVIVLGLSWVRSGCILGRWFEITFYQPAPPPIFYYCSASGLSCSQCLIKFRMVHLIFGWGCSYIYIYVGLGLETGVQI